MDVEKKSNGKSAAPVVHLLPEMPKNAGPLETCVELKANDTYFLDGRIKTAKIGCGWKATEIDVDASLAVYDSELKCVDVIWWDKKNSQYVSAEHLNDDRDGTAKEGTDVNEEILVNLEEIPPSVYHLMVVVAVYSKGKTLSDVSDLTAKLMNLDVSGTSKDLFCFKSRNFDTTAAVMGVFTRVGPWWNFTAIGETAVGRTAKEVVYSMTLDQIIREPAVLAKKYKLRTWVIEGHELAASDRPFYGPRSSDCFVEIKYKQRRGVSEVIMKSLDPKWNMEKFDLGITGEADVSVIEFNVWDHDTNSPDDFLGCVLVSVGGVCQKGEGTHNVKLSLGPSKNPKNTPKKGVAISGNIVICFEVVAIDS